MDNKSTVFTIKLNREYTNIFHRLAEERQSTKADCFRWLLLEAARVFLVDEPGSRVEDEGQNDDYPNVPI